MIISNSFFLLFCSTRSTFLFLCPPNSTSSVYFRSNPSGRISPQGSKKSLGRKIDRRFRNRLNSMTANTVEWCFSYTNFRNCFFDSLLIYFLHCVHIVLLVTQVDLKGLRPNPVDWKIAACFLPLLKESEEKIGEELLVCFLYQKEDFWLEETSSRVERCIAVPFDFYYLFGIVRFRYQSFIDNFNLLW